MKRFSIFCTCLVIACLAVQAIAQTVPAGTMARRHEILKRVSQKQVERTNSLALFNKMLVKTNKQAPHMTGQPARQTAYHHLSPVLNARKPELWGTCVEDYYGKIVSFAPAANITFNSLKELDYDVKFNGGSALIGNKLYGMSAVSFAGFMMIDLYTYDVDSWEQVGEATYIFDKTLLATETAKNPTSDKVFGQFYNAQMNGFEWGFIDYAAQERTTIKACEHRYVALGYGKDNMVYGVATNGVLYKINPQTGSESSVGATGVTIADASGNYYEQSGEIDPVTGVFYWAATDVNQISKLYTVDIETGAATEVGSLPNAILGMVVPPAAAQDKAPGEVSAVTISFVNEALSGKVSFTAPTQTYGGEALPATTPLTYKVYANSEEAAQGTVLPGGKVETQITVSGGMTNFKIVMLNELGEGAKYIENKWVGYDELNSPENLTMTNDNGKVKLKWEEPFGTVHGGYVGTITYNVYRVCNGVETLVSEKQTALTFEETLTPGDFNAYYYIVEPLNGDVPGAYAESDPFYFGKAVEPNYTQTFDSYSSANAFFKVNRVANSFNDWEWDEEMQYMKCSSSLKGKSDSWLISPPIHLTAGYTYFVKFDVIVPAGFKEMLEVRWGKDANDNETLLTEELLPVTTYSERTGKTFSYEKEITVGPDGNYNIGFHSLSESGSYFVAVDNFSIVVGPLPTAPDSVTNLRGETEASGLDEAFITFNAPDKNRKGETITSLQKIVVSEGERVIATLQPVEAGKEYTVHDKEAQHGENTYTIVAYNEDGVGQSSSITIKVGQDRPGNIKTIASIDQLSSVKLTWDAPQAAEGGVLNPAGVWYSVYDVRSSSEIIEIGQTPKGVTEYVIEDFNTFEGKQHIAYWAITPKNAVGSGGMRIKSMLVGKPYQMPFHRSFKNGTDDGLFAEFVPTSDNESWTILKGSSSDGDNGCLAFNPEKTGSAMMMLGKISLRGAVNPKLIFDNKCTSNAKRKLLIIAHPMNGKAMVLDSKDFSVMANGDAWQRTMIDIPKELTKVNYISLTILGEASEAQTATPIMVDNIHFIDPLPVDATVEMKAPGTVNKGHELLFNVKVINLGSKPLDTKTLVRVFVNGDEVKQVPLTKVINTTEFDILPIVLQTSLTDAREELELRAEVVANNDVETQNNTSAAVVAFAKHEMPQPTNVMVSANNPSAVELSWESPLIDTPTVTESFESYEPWATTMGEWTLLDMDKGYAITLDNANFAFPHNREQFAFLVAQPGDFPDNRYFSKIQPHSGEKTAMSFIQVANLSRAIPITADNWMISPILPGKKQTVDFWVRNAGSYAETFEVYYTTDADKIDITNFVKIGDTHSVKTGQWTNIVVDLPEDTRHFAIRQNTPSTTTTMFMVDDITFMKGNTPVSYNIYRDGRLIGNSKQNIYVDKDPDAKEKHTYSIAAVYANGVESAAVTAEVTTIVDAIEASDTTLYNVYTLDGIQVLRNARSLKTLQRGIYIINGKKMMVQ